MLENRLLPYAFARDFSVLASRQIEGEHTQVELTVSKETSPTAIAEAGRRFGMVKLKVLSHADLLLEIAKAYAGSGGDAADVVGEVESDLDLAKMMQDRRFVEETYQNQRTNKMLQWIETQVKPVDKDITAEEFNKLKA